MSANSSKMRWEALDLIGESCSSHAGPDWHIEWRQRSRKSPLPLPDDQGMLWHFAVAIAFSQGARSSSVRYLVREPVFAEAFSDFEPGRLARKNPEVILRRYWFRLGHMRYKTKVRSIVGCAKVLNKISKEFGSFALYLKSFRVPRRLRSARDLERFWEHFDHLLADLREREMPFFRSTTSLLQLLLDLDYDSVKPDLIVMRLARRIGMVERETGDKHLRLVARKVQQYALTRDVRAQAVDLQLLAFGGQTGSRELLNTRFCPASDPCSNSNCAVGKKKLCNAVHSV